MRTVNYKPNFLLVEWHAGRKLKLLNLFIAKVTFQHSLNKNLDRPQNIQKQIKFR